MVEILDTKTEEPIIEILTSAYYNLFGWIHNDKQIPTTHLVE